MAGEPVVTIIGNLTADPELRFTASGQAVANFTIAQTPRIYDRQTNEWSDAETLFVRASIWREAAENVAESLTKGMRVVAQGRLKARSFQTREGENRTNWELDVDEIGPSLRYATAQVTRTPRHGGGSGGGFNQNPPAQNQGGWGQAGGAPQQDPWGGAPSAGSWDTPDHQEPPF
ncbi:MULTISPECIES: single-stranded DNA-binding protein [Auritidibacter]|uniref:Single-stranded DNA-binding protein n=1 Tax=Auritidibacter ignavus TaxID=678932 RepID=A0AAJ6AHU8_9MICC|nr:MULTISPECIES: single-stranded DNA-binding protein [Auritidibacter]PXA82187.1 single-stranded DNA-binding protein [Auritidibacter sp. NML120779]AXR74502.1 single-stranded DNA-binding protein [Auritidibacter sp. NML130574]NIH72411.1 single-strand DNA-binding protein [Auritidibacter ignavus]PXA77032.1 single-stranded DNA-binding protein [Auritidibacter sp. NML100628]PXA80667.1 single-stranded DNA-binding protein [Auritidibacter sp. NML120636]